MLAPSPQGAVQPEPTMLGYHEPKISLNGQYTPGTFPSHVEIIFTQSITHTISYANFKDQQPAFSSPPYPVQSTGAERVDTSSGSTMSSQSTTTEPVFLGSNEASQFDRSTHLPTPALDPPSLPPEVFLLQINSAINSFWFYRPYDLWYNGFVPKTKRLFDEGRRHRVANQGNFNFTYRYPLNTLANLMAYYFPYQFSRAEYWDIL